MKRPENDKWLDEALTDVIGSEKPRTDFEAWKQSHPEAVEMLTSRASLETSTSEEPARLRTRFLTGRAGRETSAWPGPLKIRRIIMKSPITKFAAVAVIIIAILFVIVNFDLLGGKSIVFADVVEQIQNFRPYACTVIVQDENTPAYSKLVMHLSLTQRREVHPDGTIVLFDLAQPKTLTLNPEKKYAIEKILDAQPTRDFDLMKLASDMQKNPAHKIGVQKIDGRLTKGFHSSNKVNDITLWADVQTKLPVLVEIIHVRKERKIIMSEFKFDVNFDESLFSTTAPKGYIVEKVDKGELTELQKFAQSTTEEDLIEGLRAVAVFLGGKFPADIKLSTLQNELRQYIEENKLTESELQKRLKPVSEKWTKAHWYTKRFRGETYVGGGVKLGDAEKAIFWYRSKDSETYRVIYGDLSVKKVTPENLPK